MKAALRNDLDSVRTVRYGPAEKTAKRLAVYGFWASLVGWIGLLLSLLLFVVALFDGTDDSRILSAAAYASTVFLLLEITGVVMTAFGQQLLTLVDMAVDVRALVETGPAKNGDA